MTTALLVVDMQNEFFDEPAGQPSLYSASERINEVIGAFRLRGLPVVVVLDEEGPSRLPGQSAFEPHRGLNLEAADRRVHKQYNNSFWRTELDEVLKAAGVDTVVVSGWCAEFCVLSTYRGAVERGYRAMLLDGGIASDSPERLRMVEQICTRILPSALVELLAH